MTRRVEKFRTFEDASLALADQGQSTNDDVSRRVEALWAMSARLAAPLHCRGVHKYRSIEDAGAHRDRMTIERPRAPQTGK